MNISPPSGLLIFCYGGGVNSVAGLVLLARLGLKPHAISMSDPGSERRGTIHFRDEILPAWLDEHGFPQVQTINRIDEGRYNPRAWRLETLRNECLRTSTIPSVAYGKKKCSAKYKGDTQRWWAKRQPWAQAEWAAGRKLVKIVGYDIDEQNRAAKAAAAMAKPTDPKVRDHAKWERDRFDFWYPLIEAKMGRDECEDLIRSEGLPVPPKSACTFCPNNTLEEWEELRRDEPGAFAEAVEMSRRSAATVTDPAVVGLMRCNPHGKRQLHVWADGGYGPERIRELENTMPCESECGT